MHRNMNRVITRAQRDGEEVTSKGI